jgi:hypothetical protein
MTIDKSGEKGDNLLFHYQPYILTLYDVWTTDILLIFKMSLVNFTKISKVAPISTNFFLFESLRKN